MTASAGRVLLTGANGFVAAHILSGLVERDYHIIATVRSQQKGQQILDAHPTWKNYITFVYVSDMTVAGAYDKAFKLGDIDYIIHNASPVTFAPDDIRKDLVDPAVNGTLRLIEAAHQNSGAKLKRLVLLSSGVSILDSYRGNNKDNKGKPYTEANWNPITPEYAIEKKDTVAGYSASKVLAEKAAWDYISKHKPSFELTVLNPVIITGPMIQPILGPESINMSNVFPIYNMFNGQMKDIEGVTWDFYHFVDVRDVALAHVLALTTPAAANKRITLSAGFISPQLSLREIAGQFPELKDRIAKGADTDAMFPPDVDPTDFDTNRSQEVFGKGFKYRDLKTSVGDTVRDLLAWEKKWEGR